MLAAVLIAGCANQPPAGPQSVGLSLVAPTDAATVNVRSVTVSGRVTPTDAHVRVAGGPGRSQRQTEPALYNEASRLDIPDCGGILDTGLHGP